MYEFGLDTLALVIENIEITKKLHMGKTFIEMGQIADFLKENGRSILEQKEVPYSDKNIMKIKVQAKLDELVSKYKKQRKSASKGSQFYNNCITTVREIEHLKSFAKEFLDIEIDFWVKPNNQYDPGPIVDCKVISKKERENDWER